ncbi:hypothetical protein LTR62_002047 [Meristemomyces frigidus]|uniref:HIT domain-containing protein n=1 Tax=Meristemomyces frigidus TaxID=1508187 RepID=A0AAN7YLG7_9PEZI|nr:hypothetical protein LTR62_002047 [Meristemomyces frigidus]
MSTLQDYYPTDCPFCKIATAYPSSETSPIPSSPDPEKLDPQCHMILSTPHVLAFLDILPIAPGHILLTTRKHYRTLGDLHNDDEAKQDAQALGEWLPLLSRALCKVTGIEDWNIVQNNGERAAQVVPHIHFHFIPRYQEGRRDVGGKMGRLDPGMAKSWRMFGRGTREELDDEEGLEMALRLREALGREVGMGGKAKL